MFRQFVKVVFKYILSFTIRSNSDCLHSSNRPYLVMIIAIFIFISSKLLQYESSLLWFRQMCLLYMRNNLRHFLFAFDHLLTYKQYECISMTLGTFLLPLLGISRSKVNVNCESYTSLYCMADRL